MLETQIAPGFLVAAPQLKDPNFANTVILVLEHQDDEGSLGLVVNRLAKVDLTMVITEMRLEIEKPLEIDKHPPVIYGGPVSPERGWVLHSPDWRCAETQDVTEDICVTSSLDILKAIVSARGPLKYRFCLGYSGWGPHQLVGEIKTGAWINVPFSPDLVFDVPLAKIWSSALGRLGIDPSQLATVVGDA